MKKTAFAIALCCSFFSTVSLAEDSDATESYLTCEIFPGTTLCRDMDTIADYMNYTCTGTACYQLWQSQIDAMNDFSEHYRVSGGYRPQTSQEMGELARKAAIGICSTRATGTCEWMQAIFYAKRDSLKYLKEVQEGANIAVPYTCSVSYQCQ